MYSTDVSAVTELDAETEGEVIYPGVKVMLFVEVPVPTISPSDE